MRNTIFPKRLLPILAIALAACADSGTEPDGPFVHDVAGAYSADPDFGALTFTSTTDGETIDQLAQGASISLRLDPDGTTEGQLLVPAGDEDGSDIAADLAGTWELNGDVVTLDHDADTFLRDMPLELRANQLVGDATFSGTRVDVALQRR